MDKTIRQTAHAFITVYKALPDEVREEVKQLLLTEEASAVVTAKDRFTRYRQLEETIAPLRKDLPGDYKFDREEANER